MHSTTQIDTMTAARKALVTRGTCAPTWSDIGLHRLCMALLAWNLVGLAVVAVWAAAWGPTVLWLSDVPKLVAVTGLFGLWLVHAHTPGRPHEWMVAETLAAVLCLLFAGLWLGPGQYLVVDGERPLVDAWLASADAAVGIHVPALAQWTAQRPWVDLLLWTAYATLLPQFVFVAPFVGLYLRDRSALWEYAWHFHVCAAVTLAAWAVFPAASAFQYYSFESTIDQTRFIRHFADLRAGTLTAVHLADIEGLISMPSFHALGAIMVTWATRKSMLGLALLVPMNVLLVAATFMSGAHYAVDIAGALIVFLGSLMSWKYVGSRLLPPHREHP